MTYEKQHPWIDVFLTIEQLTEAHDGGQARHATAYKIGSKPRNGASNKRKDSLKMHLDGMTAEKAVAVCFGIHDYWYTVSDIVDSSIPEFQIGPQAFDAKAADRPSKQLLVQKDASDDCIFILVDIWMQPHCKILGWCYGWEAKKFGEWGEPTPGRPCFMVSQWDNEERKSCLHPPSELYGIIEQALKEAKQYA